MTGVLRLALEASHMDSNAGATAVLSVTLTDVPINTVGSSRRRASSSVSSVCSTHARAHFQCRHHARSSEPCHAPKWSLNEAVTTGEAARTQIHTNTGTH